MLFRHLLICKYLERSLSNTWLEGSRNTSKVNKNYRPSYIMCSLRGKMLHFIHQMTYYMFFEVIEPQWNIMETSIIKALTVSDLLLLHENFLNSCLKECMLTNQKLIAVNAY
jgi:gamma-tubulin complex component 2